MTEKKQLTAEENKVLKKMFFIGLPVQAVGLLIRFINMILMLSLAL